MKRILPVLLVLFITACAGLKTLPPLTPKAPADTPGVFSSPTFTPAPPTATVTPAPPNAALFPDSTLYKWTQVASGFDSPVDIQFPDDGSGRMFILEQVGRIRVVENGQLIGTPFLDISDLVGNTGNEQGLLGLAFHPNFKDNPYLYVNYTDNNGDTVIARFQATGNTADPNSEKILLRVDQPFANHNGGEMIFGPDGYLYLGLGDGGSQGDPNGNGQNKDVLLAKILRIDVDRGDPYAIPNDNPFVNGGGRPEVWAYGLRNPWRFSFDRLTGNLYIADVGQDIWEEIDVAAPNAPGLNFGWNYYEGSHPYAGQPPAGISITMPVAEYSHAEGGCAVTGGYVYRGAMPEWQGIYLYGDFCSGKVWGLIRSQGGWQSQILFETGFNITSFGQDASGEIYLADRGGAIYRLGK
ncbi:MAG: PQQ-dependent sugar dehydrogenase [Chloroflexi bacterium]|nr:PQQ-dependent sugar dehydrogenase [Chloroflexota bacterium]